VRRRHLLLGCFAALGAGLFTGLGLHAAGALRNPCRGALRQGLQEVTALAMITV